MFISGHSDGAFLEDAFPFEAALTDSADVKRQLLLRSTFTICIPGIQFKAAFSPLARERHWAFRLVSRILG